ncbi:MAG: TonB-dependent receptor [Gammaproteobacteria bacterium]
MEEIVVTAGFRDDTLMRAPGSVSVVSAEAVTARAARHLEDVLLAVPNVTFSAAGSRARFVQMRGIGDLEQFTDPKHFPSVGIVMDGIELSNVATGALLLDVEQVEVLRGPQGTRFGASALAGMINVRSRDPGDEFEAEVATGYGNLDTWHVTAAAGGPLTDTLSVRASVRQFNSDGFIDNAFLRADDTQDKDELAARLKLRWDPTARLGAELTTLYLDADNGYDAFSLENTRTTLADEPGSDDQEIAAVAGRISYAAGSAGTVQFSSTYTDSSELYAFDEDWVFRGFCDGVRCPPAFEFVASDSVDRDREQVTADLRWLGAAAGASLVAGAYLHHREEDLTRQRFGRFASDYQTDRYALYGQLEYPFADRLSLRLGIRGEAFDDAYDDTNGVDTQSNDTYWSGEATLEFQARADTLLYFTAARGAKPGGVNTGAISVAPFVSAGFQGFTAARLRFDTETLFNLEGGLKGRYLDDRVAVRLAVFRAERSDAQLENWVWDAANFIFVPFLDNADDAENYGVELELDALLTQTLSFEARSGWLETDVDGLEVYDIDQNVFRTLDGRDQTKAPQWSYHFGLAWQPLEAFTARVEVEGQTSHLFGYYHDGELDGYTAMNLSLAWRYRKAELRAWARNLLNTEYAVHGLYFGNDPRDGFAVNRVYEQFGEPRVYGVELSWTL